MAIQSQKSCLNTLGVVLRHPEIVAFFNSHRLRLVLEMLEILCSSFVKRNLILPQRRILERWTVDRKL